tara:strand:- start:92 stop:382 length:291 start_codon:yes stop_codon:yes gene_type:complete
MKLNINDKQKIFLITGIPTFCIWFYNAFYYVQIWLIRGNISDFIRVTIIKPLPYDNVARNIIDVDYGAPFFITTLFMIWIGSLIGFFLFRENVKND